MSKDQVLPEKSKVVCKGNVPTKLASYGVDHKGLFQYTMSLDGEVDISKEVKAISDKVIAYLKGRKNSKGEGFDKLLDKMNVAGFTAAYGEQIVEDVTASALGTASQGRAFKKAYVSANGLPADVFVSTKGTTSASTDVEISEFA